MVIQLILKKIIHFWIIFLFISLNGNTQINISFDTVFNLNINKASNEIDFLDINTQIYFYSQANKITLFNLEKKDTIIIGDTLISENFTLDFFNNFLLVKLNKKYILYSYKNNTFTKERVIINNFRNAYLMDGDKILFYNNYNYHPLDCPIDDRTKFAIYEINKNSITLEKKVNFNYLFYTHLVSEFVSVNMTRDLITYSQTLPYKISLFDLNLNLLSEIDEVIDNDSLRIEYLDTLEANGSIKNIKRLISLVSINDKNLNRIQKIFFVNDSVLMVIKKMSALNNNKKTRYIDLWRIKSNKFQSLSFDQVYSSSIFYVMDKIIHPTVPFLNSSKIILNGSKIFFINQYVPLNKIENINQLIELKQISNSKNITYGLYKFKYEIN